MWEVARRQLNPVKLLGTGGKSEVYLVQDAQTGEHFALKVIKCFTSEAYQRFSGEAHILSSLPGHSNIVQFFGARATVQKNERNKYRLLLMLFCYCSGGDLQQTIRSRPFNENMFRKVSIDVAKALQYLHTRDPPIIHQDVKMENILYDQTDERWKLCDFGSAKRDTGPRSNFVSPIELTRLEHSVAEITTKSYRPPECIDVYASQGITTQADVWMFGCVLFGLCFNKLPFEDAPVLAVLNAEISLAASDLTENWKCDFLPLIVWCLQVKCSIRATIQDCLTYLAGGQENRRLDMLPSSVREQALKILKNARA
eukprot:Gregarina_sp_Poly_1__10785@NODE_829_length_6100_cov_40_875849_g600_i0_p3_GENE_NODE_829_length_6100_cov_40_875849_g600_i0NODE_829_length_6100_cov_40_875849_g600_i0_p3_ORF_typecomplete_len313_score43_86Pkinase/PF00069_25/1_5e51Pkinase_Tyr/PF07714_17/3_1e36Kinaselike/PF14531_6/3e10Kdo/PF06293_14/5_2e06Pkinase_fungal/PF17667_1/2_1e05FTA2/PF13095_6/0_56Choline_kinase/PF01633_20/14Choline_kinase/PF01633_20/1APH/PF01636_23/0_017YrbLPhoP_reg/PF10707_9/0_036EcKinase/PF02958_20/0_064Seadorna_VP7/PF07387_1